MEIMEYLLLILLLVSIGLNLLLLKKVKDLKKELDEVGARVSVTKEELSAIRARLEKVKGKL